MLCGWEGDHRSGVALAMSWTQWSIHLRAKWPWLPCVHSVWDMVRLSFCHYRHGRSLADKVLFNVTLFLQKRAIMLEMSGCKCVAVFADHSMFPDEPTHNTRLRKLWNRELHGNGYKGNTAVMRINAAVLPRKWREMQKIQYSKCC